MFLSFRLRRHEHQRESTNRRNAHLIVDRGILLLVTVAQVQWPEMPNDSKHLRVLVSWVIRYLASLKTQNSREQLLSESKQSFFYLNGRSKRTATQHH